MRDDEADRLADRIDPQAKRRRVCFWGGAATLLALAGLILDVVAGNVLLIAYSLLVTFVPVMEKRAVALAMPGGLPAMAWMALFMLRLFRLARA